MAIINLPYDLKDVPTDEAGEVIPKGFYLCEVAKAVMMEAKTADDGTQKSAQIAITFKVVESEKPELAGYVGAQFNEYIQPFTESVKWKMKQWMDALYGRSVEGKKIDTDKWIGRKVAIRTMVDNYNNRERTKVDRFLPEAKFRKPSAGEDPMELPKAAPTSNGATKAAPAAAPKDDDEVAI